MNLQKSKFTKSTVENVFYLHREPSKGEKNNKNIDICFGTKKCDAVNRLREIRNTKVGHYNCVHMSDDEFKTLFNDVTMCFEDLQAEEVFIQALQELKPGIA